jgi:pectinesterase
MIRGLLFLSVLLPAALAGAMRWSDLLKQPAEWYASEEARGIATTVLSYQSPEGGWPTDVDSSQPQTAKFLALKPSSRAPTIDDGSTTRELRFLARMVTATKDPVMRAAFERGFDYLLAAQYENGGWPQYFPLRKGYYSHITFNDNAMVDVLTLFRDTAASGAPFTFVDEARRVRAAEAVEKGIACILRTQVKQDGRLTAWAAQHDEITLAPAWARKFEPPSLVSAESVNIVKFLMAIPDPSAEVIAAIEGAVDWLESVKLTGVREDHPPDATLAHKHDRVLVADPAAPPVWARFYELGTHRPVYGGRDGIVRYDLAEVEPERRGGYAWHNDDPARLLERDYPRWRAKHHLPASALAPAADAIVAADGSGQYASLQEAISRAPMRTGRTDPRWVIHVKPGTYRERIHVQRERGNILVRGEDPEKTVIVFNLNANLPGPDGKPIGTFRTPTLWIDADGMIWENLTIANDAGPVGQALALRVDGDRVVFRRCRFLGWQDTILSTRGRQYFSECYIEGHVDFIFGGGAAFFDRCHIHCLRDGYITAASTPEGEPHGFVFAGGKITGTEGVKTYLGRPWRNFARTVFLNTEMSAVVRPEGWHNWNKPDAEQTTFYAEHGSTGPGANDAARVTWARPLIASEADALTPQAVLSGADGWNPMVFP